MTLTTTAARIAAAALATAGLALAAGCGGDDNGSSSGSSGGSSGDGAKIALLLPENKTARYEEQDRPRFTNHVKQLCPSCEVIYENATQDAAKQQQQAEAALTRGAKVLVLDAVDVASAGSIVTRAKQQKVPVISYGRLVANAPLDYYVSIDPFKVGVQQAEVLMKALKGKQSPRIIMINGSPTDSNSAPYKKGAHSVFDKADVRWSRSTTPRTGARTRPSRRWSRRSPRSARAASTPCTSPTTAWPAGRSRR
jgi:D-xylose transport system substrate-binding protein